MWKAQVRFSLTYILQHPFLRYSQSCSSANLGDQAARLYNTRNQNYGLSVLNFRILEESEKMIAYKHKCKNHSLIFICFLWRRFGSLDAIRSILNLQQIQWLITISTFRYSPAFCSWDTNTYFSVLTSRAISLLATKKIEPGNRKKKKPTERSER